MGKHLDFYKQCMQNNGKLPVIKDGLHFNYQVDGLCECVSYGFLDGDLLDLFIPTVEDFSNLKLENLSIIYWGTGIESESHFHLSDTLTPLRQTIVLFMAAINNEL